MDTKPKELVAHAERDDSKMSLSITLGDREHHLWFAASGEDVGREPDFLLPLALFPAMVTGSRLKLLGEVSPRLLSAVPKVQDMFRVWGDEYWGGELQNLQRVSVDAEVRNVPGDRSSGVACFFSGGIDSFYTLFKHRDEITHLIFVHGFDIALEDQSLRAQASRMAREVAKEMGKTLIEVETNLRSFSHAVSWKMYHGAAMASVALLFQHSFRKVLIASTYTYAELVPRGSHALLDPLWSTELTEIEHDGGEATRFEEVAYISEHDLAMKWLRVCFQNPESAYNCGHCEKCLRTSITLQMAGALERCKTLPSDLDLEEVANMHIPPTDGLARQNLRALERLGTEPELAQALREAIQKSSGANEGGTRIAQRQRLEQQLSLAHKKLERTRAKLKASSAISKELHKKLTRTQAELARTRAELEVSRKKSSELAERNRSLTARYSARRYGLADALMGVALRIPGVGKLVGRKSAAG